MAAVLKNTSKLKLLQNQVVGHFITVGIGLLTSVIWARMVSLELFGHARLATSIADIVGAFCLSGLAASASISSGRGYHGNFTRLLIYKLFATSFAAIILGGIGIYYLRNISYETGLALIIIGAFMPITRLMEIWSGWMFGLGKLNVLLLQQIAGAIMALCAPLLLMSFGLGKSPIAVFLAMAVPAAICSLSFIIAFYAGKSRMNSVVRQDTISFGLKTSGGSAVSSILMSDKVLVERCLGIEAVAVYSVATVFSNHAKTAFRMLTQLVIPDLYTLQTMSEVWEYLRKKIALVFIASSAVGIIGGMGISLLLPLLYSEKYRAAGNLGGWLWAIVWLSFSPTILGAAVMARQNVLLTNIVMMIYPWMSIGVLWILLIGTGSIAAIYGRSAFDLLFFFALYISFFFTLLKVSKRDIKSAVIK